MKKNKIIKLILFLRMDRISDFLEKYKYKDGYKYDYYEYASTIKYDIKFFIAKNYEEIGCINCSSDVHLCVYIFKLTNKKYFFHFYYLYSCGCNSLETETVKIYDNLLDIEFEYATNDSNVINWLVDKYIIYIKLINQIEDYLIFDLSKIIYTYLE
jgi:hypothetical protein